MKGKRLFSLLLALVLCVGALPVVASAAETNVFNGGSGTFSDPYLISTKAQLNEVRNYLSSHFKLTANIAFQSSDFAKGGVYHNDGAYWIPIGDSGNPFTGTFDGNGKKISGLRQQIIGTDSNTTYYGGLFGYTKSACIQNLSVSATIQVQGKGDFKVGGIVGALRGLYTNIGYSIYNCSFSGSITCNIDSEKTTLKTNIGGILGVAANPNENVADDIKSYVANCTNSGTIQSNSGTIGGITGRSGRIFNCSNSGTVTGADWAGGISGYSPTVFDSYNTAKVGGTTAGGISGFGAYSTRCYNTGAITGTDYAGGICGRSSDFSFRNCYNTGAVSGKGYSGGLSGDGGTFYRCYNIGIVSGATVGAIWGAYNNSYNRGYYLYYSDINNLAIAGECSGGVEPNGTIVACTDSEMRVQSTFEDFDFEEVWTMDGVSTYPYPELRSVKMVTESLKTTAVVIFGDTSCEIPVKDDVAQITLTATASLQNSYISDTKNVTNSATWSVVDSPVGVSISKGVVSIDSTAKAGNITIKASYNGKNGTYVITLNSPSDPCANGHSFTNYVSNNDATCTADGTKTAKCDNCDATDTIADVGSKKNHSFITRASDQQVSAATCTEAATYYVQCDHCDAVDQTQTVSVGEPKGHSATHFDAIAPTYDAGGNIEHWYCPGCGKYFSDAACTKELADVTLPPRAPDVTAALTADGVLTITGALSENAATTNTVFLAVYRDGRMLCVKDISSLAQNNLQFVCGDMQGADTVKIFRLGSGHEPRFAVCAIKIS